MTFSNPGGLTVDVEMVERDLRQRRLTGKVTHQRAARAGVKPAVYV